MRAPFSQRMMDRVDYWRGFTGGLLAGVAIGAWIYFSPSKSKTIDSEGFDNEKQSGIFRRRGLEEVAVIPSGPGHEYQSPQK